MTAPKQVLTVDCWRYKSPTELYERKADFCQLLLRITALTDERARRLLASAASTLSADDALGIGQAVIEEHGRGDLAMAWLALAGVWIPLSSGCLDTRFARTLVGVHLAELAEGANRWGTGQREMIRLRKLSFDWLAPIADFAKAELFKALELAKNAGKPSPQKLGRHQETVITGPTLTVCREIPSGTRAEERALVANWGFLTAPLPLAAGPAPDVLEAVLLAEFPWLIEAIRMLVGDLRLRHAAGLGFAHWRPLLLVGPPGSGKTRLARRIAELVGAGYGEVSAAGSSDNRSLMGTARGWSTATPTQVLHVMRQSRTANPVLLVDEIDKANTGGSNGSILQTLLTMVEPLSAASWTDECLATTCNLSKVNWVATANSVERLRGPLLTRFRVAAAPMPGVEHLDTLLVGIERDLMREFDLPELPEMPPKVRRTLKAGLVRGISVRRVRAAIEAFLRAEGLSAVTRH